MKALKMDFDKPKVRTKLDMLCIIILTLMFVGLVLYNTLLPNNTIIKCDKNINKCRISYTNILNTELIHKSIITKISNIESMKFSPGNARRLNLPNVDLLVKSEQYARPEYIFYYHIIEPSVNKDSNIILANSFNEYLKNSENTFYYSRNDNVNPITRIGYIFGIFIYYLISLIMLISDIRYYQKFEK